MIVGISGGTGFVGRRVVEQHVARGDRVRVLSRSGPGAPGGPAGAEWYPGDLASGPEPLAKFVDGLDVLYHCAGETRDETRMRATNVRGTENLLAAAAGRIGHWVQLSSVGVYGPRPAGIVTEDTVLAPAGEYEVTKTEAEQLAARRSASGGFSCSTLRPCNIMGVGMRDRSLYAMVSLVKRGVFFHIGTGRAILNYVHVDDVARALVLAGTSPAARGGTFNLARQITVDAFAAAIADALGVPAPRLRLPEAPVRLLAAMTAWLPRNPLSIGRIEGLTGTTVYTSERICRRLGFACSRSIEDGLREIVADWRAAAA
jgi:nucleoside-diphosphate-sugar epimerase